MTPQELKNSILQLAIQGKLVEQRADEGTGAELLEKILAAKNAEGAKKAGVKSHAKSAKSAKVGSCVSHEEIPDDEKPFEIPESWEWVRLGDVVSNRAGLAYSKGNLIVKKGKMIRVLRGGNIADMGYCTKPDDVMISDEFVNSELFLRRNMLITPAVTSLDHVGKMARIEDDYDDMVVGGFVLMLTPYIEDDIFSRYFLCACSSKYFRDCCRNIVNKSGQAFYNLSRTKMMELIFPLPPLAEQKRIVAKIEELLPLIDRYEKAWSRLEDFNKRFPADMQKSLLQMAIQGKLVEQRAEEGTGRELLEKILAAKNAKGAKGREIKHTRSRGVRGGSEDEGISNLPKAAKSHHGKLSALSASPREEIPDDEKPFEIPESWEWVRLGECSSYAEKKEKIIPSEIKPDDWSLDLEDIEKDTGRIIEFRLARDRRIIGDKVVFRKGQILYSKLRPYLKKILIAPNDGICTPELVPFSALGGIDARYLVVVLKSPHVDFVINSVTYGVKMPRVGTETMVSLPIPLPPLAEQKRIVAKLEELLPLCERLK